MKTFTKIFVLMLLALIIPNKGILSQSLTGTKTIGASGTYSTFAEAINDLNTNGVGTGGVIFLFTDAVYSESYPLTITAQGTVSNPITFKPAPGISPIITLAPVYNEMQDSVFGLRLSGTNHIIFDGSSSDSDTRDLTFELSDNGNVFWIGEESDNSVIKNCIIKSFSNDSVYSIGIKIRGAGCDSTLIQNNKICNAYRGIYAYVPSSSGYLTGTRIINNIVGDINYPINTSGIDCGYTENLEIIGNEVCYVIRKVKGNNPIGISVSTAPNQILKIEKNKIHHLYSNCYEGMGGRGIDLFVYANSPTVSIQNNMIWAIGSGTSHKPASTLENYIPMGIHMFRITSFTGGTFKLYHNSIYITPDNIHGLNPDMSRVIGVWVGIGFTGKVDFRNNIVKINLGENVATSNSDGFAFYCESTTADPFIPGSLNNNIYQITGQDLNYVGRFKGVSQSFAGWKTATGQDANSYNQDPMFVSVEDLHIQDGQYINGSNLSVLDDIDNNLRGTTPDIGADEYFISTKANMLSVEKGFSAYPNPSTEKLIITNYPNNSIELKLYDVLGNIVINRKIENTQEFELNTGTIKDGIYFLIIATENDSYMKKIIVRHN